MEEEPQISLHLMKETKTRAIKMANNKYLETLPTKQD